MSKRNILAGALLAAVAALALSCGGNNNPSVPSDTLDSDQATLATFYDPNTHTTVIGIQDKASEHPVDLFRGSYDDSLLAALLPSGAARSAINVYLAQFDDGPTVLFDAGLGAEDGILSSGKIDPAKVTAVCLTHLHPDHIGGLLQEGKASFPNATIYLSKTELASTRQWESTSYVSTLWQQVLAAYPNRIVTFADSALLFDGRVQTIPAPGHTSGHTVFQIGSCLIAGDILHSQDLQLQHPEFCARYDQDPARAVATRKQILEYVRNNNLQLCGAHCYDFFIKWD